MDDELRVVVTSVLEADEEASAQRIVSQLPEISRRVNQSSHIQIGVELASQARDMQSQVQRLSRQMSNAARCEVGVTLSHIDRSTIADLRNELSSIGVEANITTAITQDLDKMGVRIDRISSSWRECVDGEQRLLNLTIQGTDQIGRSVTYLNQYRYEAGEVEGTFERVSSTLTNITANLERQRQEEARNAAQMRADNESRIQYLSRQRSILNEIHSMYTGASSAKPVTGDNLADLNDHYNRLLNTITTLDSVEGGLGVEARANIDAQIASLKLLVREYQNAEYVATQLRTKGKGQIKTEQFSELNKLEEQLRSSGLLTGGFERGIEGLREKLRNAFSRDEITAFLNSFDKLRGGVSVFQEQLNSVNNIYKDIISVDKKIASVRSDMIGLDPEADKDKLAALQNELIFHERNKQALEAQLLSYGNIVQYAKQASVAEQERVANELKLQYSQAEIADMARNATAEMQKMPAVIQNVEARFNGVNHPTAELTERIKSLRPLMDQFNNASEDSDKVIAFNRLQEALRGCNREITALLGIERIDLRTGQFVQGLEKAKSDLATIGRQWSALKNDRNLASQFGQLQRGLSNISNSDDLRRWTAQFNAFKSEVKAAGKNVMSLGHTLKNNLGKVTQWITATTILFRAFRLLKDAVSTVISLDTAMIDLRKTTDATEAEYREFYFTANETAKALGSTTEEVIAQTAEWSRLGYAIEDASELAKNSAVFAAVSPEMEQQAATDGLISMIKAFDIDVEDTMDGIISKVNEVGNKFAVSNADIVEAMTRSSAAMAAANNTFDETVALATAAIEITRDAASVGKKFAQCYSNVA